MPEQLVPPCDCKIEETAKGYPMLTLHLYGEIEDTPDKTVELWIKTRLKLNEEYKGAQQ